MIKRNHIIKVSFLLAGDALMLYAALLGALVLRYGPALSGTTIRQHFYPFTLIFALWLLFFGAFGLYDLKIMKNGKAFLYRLFQVIAANTAFTILVLYIVLPIFEIEPRRNLFIIAVISIIFIFIWRYLFNLFIVRSQATKLIFLGVNKETMELADYLLKNPQLGQRPAAFISGGETNFINQLPIPNFVLNNQDFIHIIRDTGADTIVISREMKENKAVIKSLFQVIPLGISVIEFTAIYEMLTGKIPLSLIEEAWFLENLIGAKKNLYEFFKRGLDFAVAAILIIPAAMFLPFIAIAIKLDSDGPVFYRQKRVGRHGKEFELLKYRTMVKNADELEGFKGNGADARQTRVGYFLRKSYIDELPQIINIFNGEMSFIGPRPERPKYVQELKNKIPFYEMRLLVPPGITGWAQTNMENDASVEDAPEKMQYDLYYIKNRSFILDLLIILKTIFIIIRRTGR